MPDSEIPYNLLACVEEMPELSRATSELAKSHMTDKVALLSSLAFLSCTTIHTIITNGGKVAHLHIHPGF